MGRYADRGGNPPAGRKKVQPAVEEHDQQQAEPERRRGDPRNRQGPADLVDPAVTIDGRQDAERHAEGDRDQERGDAEFDRRRKERADVVQHRPAGADRHAEIAGQQVPDIAPVLDVDRLVEAQPFAHGFDDLFARPFPGHQACRVAGDQVGHREGDHRNPEHDENQENEAFSYDRKDLHRPAGTDTRQGRQVGSLPPSCSAWFDYSDLLMLAKL